MRSPRQTLSHSAAIAASFLLFAACATVDGDAADDAAIPTPGTGSGSTTFSTPGSEGPGNEGNGGGATGTTGRSDDSSGGGFIGRPDGGVVAGQCDPAAQDCAEGEKCTSYVSVPGGQTVDATKCVPTQGNALAGEACIREADNDDCATGFFCMTDVSGNTGNGFCLEYCDIMTMVCEFGGECFAFNGGALPVCEVTCDPLLQDCPTGQGCYAAFDDFVCAVPGHPDGQGGDGDECATVQGCQPGLLCQGETDGCTANSCCTPVCALSNGGAECTAAAEECVAALDAPPPGLADVGFCGVPA